VLHVQCADNSSYCLAPYLHVVSNVIAISLLFLPSFLFEVNFLITALYIYHILPQKVAYCTQTSDDDSSTWEIKWRFLSCPAQSLFF
jgi:hypothetical protein